jgi:hypothetical protein
MNIIHRSSKRAEFSASLSRFLEFALKSAKDVVERQATLPWWTHAATHATHSCQPLLLQRRSSLIRRILEVESRSAARSCLASHAVMLMLLCPGGNLGILLGKYTDDSSGDFMVNDCLVVLADDVDTEFHYIITVKLKRF